MFIGIKTDSAGVEQAFLYYNMSDWIRDSFSPDYIYNTISFKITGKTYEQRKAAARDLAITYQNIFSSLYIDMWEYSDITNYLERVAKRYGLIKEFRENGII